MLVTPREILRVIHTHRKATFDFPLYSQKAELGIAPTETLSRRTYLPAGTLTARTDDEQGQPVAEIFIDRLVNELWESLSRFEMDNVIICQRTAFGQLMLSENDELFSQSQIEQLIEDDLVASRNGREVIVPDLSEEGATSLMRGFKTWRANGGQ